KAGVLVRPLALLFSSFASLASLRDALFVLHSASPLAADGGQAAEVGATGLAGADVDLARLALRRAVLHHLHAHLVEVALAVAQRRGAEGAAGALDGHLAVIDVHAGALRDGDHQRTARAFARRLVRLAALALVLVLVLVSR